MYNAENQTYLCTCGETWASIAYKLWTEETLLYKLIEANPLRANILVFEGGEVLKVPEIEKANMKAALPPWRQ